MELVSLTPMQALGIPVALVGTGFLAVGTQLQHRGVRLAESDSTVSASDPRVGPSIRSLVARPSWLLGTMMLGIAIVLQLASLSLAPLTVVQPIGAVALVLTAVIHARVTKTSVDRHTLRAIGICVGGIALFVGVAAATTASTPVTDRQLGSVLVLLALVLLTLCVCALLFRGRLAPSIPIVSAGILFGFVATLAKTLIDRAQTLLAGGGEWLAGGWLLGGAVAGVIVATVAGSYLVQVAHTTGPPDLVVAGLTVIDPLVGVTIGIVVLGEAASAPIWAVVVFLLSGAVAALGVVDLSRRQALPTKTPAAEPTPTGAGGVSG